MHLFRNMDADDLAEIMGPDDANEQLDRVTDRKAVHDKLKPGSTVMDGSTLQVRRWRAPVATSLDPDDGDTYSRVPIAG